MLINPPLYVPRADSIVLEDLLLNGINDEIKELCQLVDTCPDGVLQCINEIINVLVKSYQIAIATPKIYLSTIDKNYSCMINATKNPLLIISKRLLQNVKNKDELAAVIARGLVYLKNDLENPDTPKKAMEQFKVDTASIELLEKAGYNPKAAITFLNREKQEETQFVGAGKQVSTALEVLKNIVKTVKSTVSETPKDELRIRKMEMSLSGGKRSGEMDEKTSKNQDFVLPFHDEVKQTTYQSPIANALQALGYEQQTTTQKMQLLTELLKTNYPSTNRVYAKRLDEIPAYIDQLVINFTNADEVETFKELTDPIMGTYTLNQGESIVHPASYVLGLTDCIKTSLLNLWKKGGKDSALFARQEDFKEAIEHFVQAKDKITAEQSALKVIALYNKLNQNERSINCHTFSPIYMQIVEQHLKTKEPLDPQYQYYQHVLWCKEKNDSQSIKKVLQLMFVDLDPWAKPILGNGGNYSPLIDKLIYYTEDDATKSIRKDYTGLKQLIRNETGGIDGIKRTEKEAIPAYNWKYLDKKVSLEELTVCHTQENINKQAYELAVLNDVDWVQLRVNFPDFIQQYGQLLYHHYSIIEVACPFAEEFYKQVAKSLQDFPNDIEFKEQVLDFIRHRHDSNTPHNLAISWHLYDLEEKGKKWPYSQVTRPSYLFWKHPFLQFLLNKQTGLQIIDTIKLLYLSAAKEYVKPDKSKTLAQTLHPDLTNIIMNNLDAIDSATKLLAASKITSEIDGFFYYPNIIVALKAEELAHRFEESISLQDYVILNDLVFIYKTNYINNLDSSFKTLGEKSLNRSINVSSLKDRIENYRFASAYGFFLDSPSLRDETLISIINKLDQEKSVDNCINYLKALLKPENYGKVSYTYNYSYDGYISDPELRDLVVQKLTNLLTHQMGEDDAEEAYYAKAKLIIDDLAANTTGDTQLSVLTSLANKINAQERLALYLGDIYKQCLGKKVNRNGAENIVAELILEYSRKDKKLRKYTLDFLRDPLTASSPKSLRNYLLNTHSGPLNHRISEVAIDDQLSKLHKNFRASSLEMKTVYLEAIVFPLGSEDNEQIAIIGTILDDMFPITAKESNENNNQNALARLIIETYLNNTEIAERRLICTALYVSNMREPEEQNLTVGKKLNIILSNMGPAGGKLLQAIHSHPQTPQSIAKELACAKTMFAPPTRWELVELVTESKLLEKTDENPNPIVHIGRIEGAGSFGLTVFNELSNKTKVADTFLRKNAAKRAEREFKIMENSAKALVAEKSELGPIVPMIQEARKSAKDETDMVLAQKANQMAERSYSNLVVRVGQKIFFHKVARLYKTGQTFKRAEIVTGTHFIDLRKLHSDSKQINDFAIAMIATQLSLRFSGHNTDLDRHAGNIKIEDNTIAHFDFGAMNIAEISEEDKAATGVILARVIISAYRGEDFTKALLAHIEKAQVSEKTRRYLSSLNKDVLALGDYISCLDKHQLASIMASCLNASSVDKTIRAAFNSELGLLAYPVRRTFSNKAKESVVQVFYNPIVHTKPDIDKTIKDACFQNDVPKLYNFIKQQQWDINTLLDQKGTTLLTLAKEGGNNNLKNLLDEMGANQHKYLIESVDTDAYTIDTKKFMEAVVSADILTVDSMLKKGFAYSSSRCWGAMEMAIQANSYPIIDLLLEQGESINNPSLHQYLQENAHHQPIKLISKSLVLEQQKQQGMMNLYKKHNGDFLACKTELLEIQTEFALRKNAIRAEHAIRYAHEYNMKIEPVSANMLNEIADLLHYGEELKARGDKKGIKVINLANQLSIELQCFNDGHLSKERAILRINALINQGKVMMRQDRRALDIIAHIALALTGVGLLILITHKVKTGTFFLNRTKREKLLDEAQEVINLTKC